MRSEAEEKGGSIGDFRRSNSIKGAFYGGKGFQC